MATATRTGLASPDEKRRMTLQVAAVYISSSVNTVRQRIASRDCRRTCAASVGFESFVPISTG
ncbi:hypothetical protein ncot_00185 [Nocardioides sp. JQ2195]|nr:hypothetical protein ncot_00185 [Nocardioides sp. JQ2195]